MGAITAEVVDTGEKRDARGRRVTPAEQRLQMVQAYRASGVTMAAFARRERIKYATFAGWVAKAGKTAVAKRPIQFAEMRMPFPVPGAPADDRLEVRFPDGTVLRGTRATELIALVRGLRA
jgi:transposase-like protein